MSRGLSVLLKTVSGLALLALLVLAGAIWLAGTAGPDWNITVNGEPWTPQNGESFAGIATGLGIALLVLLAVPLALLLGVGLPLLIVGAVLAAVFVAVGAVLSLAFSPVLLLILLVWWLIRRDRASAGPR